MTIPTRRSLKYPLTVDDNGSLMLSEDGDCVRDGVISTLQVRPAERIMQPRLGTPSYVFDSVTDANLIPARLEVAIADQVADAQNVQATGAIAESGILDIEVRYEIDRIAQPPIGFRLRV